MISKLKSLKDHQGFMKYFKNTSWLFVEKILRMIIGFFVGVWVARYLGPEQFGLLSYVQSFVGLFGVITTLGLDTIVVRELVKNEGYQNQLISTVFLLKLIGAFVLLIVLGFVIQFTSNDQLTKILVFIIASATIFQAFNVIDMYFQSQVLSKYVVYANMISLFISSLMKITLIIFEAPLITFAFVILFDSFVLASGLLYFYFKHESKLKIQKIIFTKSLAFRLLKDAFPIIISTVFMSIYMKIDQLMIKEMINSSAVGYYAVSSRLSEMWYFIPLLISSSIFPAILNAKKHSKELYYDRLQKLYNLMIWLSIVVIIFIHFFGQTIVYLLYGNAYSSSANVLTIHIFSSIFVAFGIARSKWIVAENLQKYTFYMHVAGAVINIFLNLFMIKEYGIIGAAVASLISYFIALIILPLLIKDLRISIVMYVKSFLYPYRFMKGI